MSGIISNCTSLRTLLISLQEELESGKRSAEHEKLYAKYFDVQTTPVRGCKVVARPVFTLTWASLHPRYISSGIQVK